MITTEGPGDDVALVPDTPPPAGVISAVLRGGADALAPGPEVAEQLPDPSLQPALHRLVPAAPPVDLTDPAAAGDDEALVESPEAILLRQAARYLLLAPVALRVVVLTCATAVLLSVYGVQQLRVLAVVVVVLELIDLGALVVLLRGGLQATLWRPVALVGGLGLAVAANLVVAAEVSRELYVPATSVTGGYLVGTVVLWTVTLGWRRAVVPVLVDVPLQIAMAALHRGHVPGAHVEHLLAYVVAGLIGLALAMVAALLALAVVGLGNRVYMVAGIRAGQQSERARMLRGLHDTVLQTLETIAMSAPDDRARPAQALAKVRGMARRQALDIRRTLGRDGAPERSEDLLDDLESLVAEAGSAGLRVELVCDDLDRLPVDPTVRAALRDAVREALRNVQKHAGVSAAVLRVERLPGTVVATVRDHGVGFDVAQLAPGFGLTHSVSERLAELGGTADISSRPGRGTRVRLSLPVPDDAAE